MDFAGENLQSGFVLFFALLFLLRLSVIAFQRVEVRKDKGKRRKNRRKDKGRIKKRNNKADVSTNLRT